MYFFSEKRRGHKRRVRVRGGEGKRRRVYKLNLFDRSRLMSID